MLHLNKLNSDQLEDISRPEIVKEVRKLINDTVIRDIYANALNEEIKRRSRKYYNETEII